MTDRATFPRTPYDSLVGLWHHWGRKASNQTIDDFARTIQQRAPAIKAVFIKTHHGPKWMSEWGDSSPSLAISGADSIRRWVETLNKYNMEFHAWCVPEGIDLPNEAQRMIDVANVPGVKSLILDVEPYTGFYKGPRSSVRPLMSQVRANIAGGFHISMSVDPRPQHFKTIFPDEWFPFVGSILPQVYWRTFQVTPDKALADAYSTWQGYRRPIYPVFQVLGGISAEMTRARSLAISQYRATGLSWWLHSAITEDTWATLNVAMDGTVPTTPTLPPDTTPRPDPNPIPNRPTVPTGLTITVRPNDATYRDGTYDGSTVSDKVRTFTNARGTLAKFMPTSATQSNVWARWSPQINKSAWYEVSAFVPSTNATTNRARYKVHGIEGRDAELEVQIAQDNFNDVWVPLGTFYLNANNPQAGMVFLNDLTGESNLLIALDGMRWRELGFNSGAVADGFDPPIGSAAERAGAKVWPGGWFDATGFGTRYRIGSPAEAYHTGSDLNLNVPTWDTDANSPIYATASGVVTTMKIFNVWGYVIIIRHDPLASTGQVVYSRYGHITSPRVREGQRVQRGDQIANVGNAQGTQPYHLHYDVSPTEILAAKPDHWPKLNFASLQANYINPRIWISNNRPARR